MNSQLVPAEPHKLEPAPYAYSSDIWELAKELWLFRCARNTEATARELAREVPGGNVPTARAIRKRVSLENWNAWASERLATLAPQIDAADAETLYQLRGATIQRLHAIVTGQEDAKMSVIAALSLGLQATGVMAKANALSDVRPQRINASNDPTSPQSAADIMQQRLEAIERQRQP